MAFGVTSEGFVRPRLIDIKGEIEQSLIATFGANINLNSNSIFGQLVGIFSEREDLVWQAMEDTYNSQYPDTAFGVSLDNVGAISGIPRLGETFSTLANVKLFGTAGTPIPQGSQGGVVGSPLSVFQTTSAVVLAAGQNCIQLISFSAVPTIGQWQISDSNGNLTAALAFNANAAAVQAAVRTLPYCSGCTVSGDYTAGFTINFLGAGTGGFMVQGLFEISLNTLEAGIALVSITPSMVQPGIDQADVNMVAINPGPVIANAGTLTNIVTPVTGLDAILNTIDAEVGRNVETDNEYRARRLEELQIAGAGTVEAIRSKLLALTGVTAVVVFENVTEIEDPDGRPPKSFEAIVQGGDDTEIANEIWQVKPAGIESDGSTIINITDSQGQTHPIRFSRPTNLLVYVHLVLTVDTTFPANGDASSIQAIVSAGNALGIGKEVITIPYLISSLSNIPGIQDAILNIGLAPNPTTQDNIQVAPNQIAVFDTSRVIVTHTL